MLRSEIDTYEDYLEFERELLLKYQWKRDNLEKTRKSSRDWSHRNAKGQNKKLRIKRKELRELIIWLLGNKCKHCRIKDHRVLQIDHVNGGGVKELRSLTPEEYNHQVLESIEKGEEKYQCLCANCNWIKKVENHESPGSVI